MEIIPANTVNNFWVKVKDGEVLEVWNEQPTQDELDSGLWREAVEVFPEYISGRETINGHTIDITQDPVQIIYGKTSIGVDNRVRHAKFSAQMSYKEVVTEETEGILLDTPVDADMDRITNAKNRLNSILSSLDSVTTHEEFEALDLTFSV